MKKRWFPKRPKNLKKGYDSKLEQDLHEGILSGYIHHPDKVGYKVEHTYEPDFVHPDEPGILIEVKGRFRDSAEAAKYVWIQRCNPDLEIVFIFQNPGLAMPFAKIRKDGTKRSHKEWAEKNGFRNYSQEEFALSLK